MQDYLVSGLFSELTKNVVEPVLRAELTECHGHECGGIPMDESIPRWFYANLC